jgi:MSHA pilin protein MshC
MSVSRVNFCEKIQLKNTNQGFTLIELVIVIIMIGILSAAVIPKFFDSSGFEEIAIQSELVTKLRSIQLRAMHQTSQSQCPIEITAKMIQLKIFDGSNCISNSEAIHNTTKVIIEEGELSFSPLGVLSFDSLGKPNCDVDICEILIEGGEQAKTVTINIEGYIYASN